MLSIGGLAQLLLLGCAVALTLVFFARSHLESEAFAIRTWDVAPTASTGVHTLQSPHAPCNDTAGRSVCALEGVMQEYEGQAALVSVPLMCFAACVVGTAYALVHPSDTETPSECTLGRKVALGLLFAFGVLVLGTQDLWKLPMSHIMGVLTVVLVAFFHLGTKRDKPDLSVRALQPAMEVPLLGAAVLAVSHPSCSFTTLCSVSASTAAVMLLCMALWHELEEPPVSGVYELSIALLLLPVIVAHAMAISGLQALSPLAPLWLTASTALYVGGLVSWVTLHVVACYRPQLRLGTEYALIGLKTTLVLVLLVSMLAISEQ
jgi:hypothetical protein